MVISAINETDLNDLINYVLKCADEVNDILNKFDNKFYDLKYCYQGKSAVSLNKFYSDIRERFPVVRNNLVSYAYDLISLRDKMHQMSSDITKKLEDFTEDAKNKAKQV